MLLRTRIFALLAVLSGLLAQVTFAQKPAPPPATPPPSNPPSNPTTASAPISRPIQPDMDRVMFLSGHIATNDGSALPNDVMVERICNERVRQQSYATPHGDFSMQLGTVVDSFLDASADGAQQHRDSTNPSQGGIPRRELTNCDLRASASGFHPSRISLAGLTTVGESIDVGSIVVQRPTKTKGTTLSAALYKLPKDARIAYEKGLEAEQNRKLANARGYFEKAVQLYPKFAKAWFELGNVLRETHQKDAAYLAYTNATSIDAKFLPPYLPLASMACQAENWAEALNLTNHILDLDPFKNATGYLLDLDLVNYAEAYFYNSVANYNLDRIDEAEKSALQSERKLAQSPQLHLLLARIFARKANYSGAVSELQTYLELDPRAKNADEVREQLAEFEKLKASAATKPPTN